MQENIVAEENQEIKTELGGLDNKYLTFFIGEQLFGIPISNVIQIVGMQEITEIPGFPQYAKGIINLRGSIIPVIDVRLRLSKEEKDYDERTCIIVTNILGKYIGLIVDAVDAVSDISSDKISAPPQMSNIDKTAVFLTGVAKYQDNIILLMDTERFLSEDDLEEIMTMSGERGSNEIL